MYIYIHTYLCVYAYRVSYTIHIQSTREFVAHDDSAKLAAHTYVPKGTNLTNTCEQRLHRHHLLNLLRGAQARV